TGRGHEERARKRGALHVRSVSTLPETCVCTRVNGQFAGPLTTVPAVVKREPWHGHTKLPSKPPISQVSCVQIALNAEYASCQGNQRGCAAGAGAELTSG